MAKVTANIKRIQIHGEVTLVISPEEAVFLKQLLSLTSAERGWHDNVEELAEQLWVAMNDAGVPDAGRLFREKEITVLNNTVDVITQALVNFRSKT